jgi:hypothetical protein
MHFSVFACAHAYWLTHLRSRWAYSLSVIVELHYAHRGVRDCLTGKKLPFASLLVIQSSQLSRYSDWATGWTIGVLGINSRRGMGIFLFTIASRTALGPTQPPIQWVPGAFSMRVKRPGREADHSPPSSAKAKERMELYLQSPNTPSWRGVQLKKKSTGTILPLSFTF